MVLVIEQAQIEERGNSAISLFNALKYQTISFLTGFKIKGRGSQFS